jgi:hypothetical protein
MDDDSADTDGACCLQDALDRILEEAAVDAISCEAEIDSVNPA